MANRIVLFLILISSVSGLNAQAFTLRGKIMEEKTGIELPGVTVAVEGTTRGTQTDIDGSFSLPNMKVGEKLSVSCIGMESISVILTAKEKNAPLLLRLKEVDYQLQQIIVTGYGTTRKRDVTGAITSISSDDIKNAPNNNAMSALQGKVPGLTVVNSGSAGSSPDVKIRGIGTLNASSNPLYVVDGMLLTDINFLSTNDIASIEVLKDPSSLAIFGVQGANGVIIVTTKRADTDKTSVSYEGYAGLQVVWRRDRVKLTNASQFTTLYNEMLQNQDPLSPSWVPSMLGVGTDWQSKVIRQNAFMTNHSLTVSRSGKQSKSLLSVGYFKQDGMLNYNSYERFNIRFSQDYSINKNLNAGGGINLSQINNTPASAKIQNAVMALPTYVPYAPIEDYDPENPGSRYTPSADIQQNVSNPVAHMDLFKGTEQYRDYRAIGNVYGEWLFLKDFSFRATGYIDFGFYKGQQYTPRYDVNNENSHSSDKNEITTFYRKADFARTLQADYLLNYKKNIGSHRVSATAGYTARKAISEGMNAKVDSLGNGIKVVPEDLQMLSMGSKNNINASDWWNEESFISYLARANYSYEDRYLLTATFRADASSKFSPKNRWGYFPSVGLGWIVSEEKFMKPIAQTLDFLKLRASWGMLGNDKIGNYLYFPTIDPMGKQIVVNGKTVYIPTAKFEIDENIHWEVMTGFDIGISSMLFNRRLSLELGYFSKNTNDLLAFVAPSSSIGAGYAITNAGSVNNSGVEYTVAWNDNIGNIRYGIQINGGTLQNKVTALGDNNSDIISGDYHRTSVGHPIGSYYGYVQDGIFQNEEEIKNYHTMQWRVRPGDIRYKDLNNDGKITDADRTFLGSAIPTFSYGMNLTFGYKNFDFAVDLNGVTGNKILDLKNSVAWTQTNLYSKSLERWHGEGTSNHEPILDKTRGHNYLPSSNLLEDGSYFRLRSMQLGYTIPQSASNKLRINKLRVYLSGQNLLTLKCSSGYTPEIGGNALTAGMDQGDTYPIPATYTIGLSINF